MYIEFKIPISAFYLNSQNRNLKFNVHKSSCLACIDVLSSIVNHHPYYFLFTQFIQNHNFDPYSTCLNLQIFCPPSAFEQCSQFLLLCSNYAQLCPIIFQICSYKMCLDCSIRVSNVSVNVLLGYFNMR